MNRPVDLLLDLLVPLKIFALPDYRLLQFLQSSASELNNFYPGPGLCGVAINLISCSCSNCMRTLPGCDSIGSGDASEAPPSSPVVYLS